MCPKNVLFYNKTTMHHKTIHVNLITYHDNVLHYHFQTEIRNKKDQKKINKPHLLFLWFYLHTDFWNTLSPYPVIFASTQIKQAEIK